MLPAYSQPPPLPSDRKRKRLFIVIGVTAAALLLIAAIVASSIYIVPHLVPMLKVVYTVDAAGVQPDELEQTAQILNQRWHALGGSYRVVNFQPLAGDQIGGEIPAEGDMQLIKQMASAGIIEFVDFGDEAVPVGSMVQTDLYGTGTGDTYHTIFTGREIQKATLETDNFGNIAVKIQLSERGRQMLADHTTAHVGDYLGLVWDGEVIFAPQVAGAITDGVAILSGFGSEAQGRAFMIVARSGVLPLPLKVSEVSIPPESLQPEE